MVTYHYVKFYVSIIIQLEVININVRNFKFLEKPSSTKFRQINFRLFNFYISICLNVKLATSVKVLITAMWTASRSIRSASLFINSPLVLESIVRHAASGLNAACAAFTALSTSAFQRNKNNQVHKIIISKKK